MVKLGIKGRQETTVTTANIAANVGSGKVKVFATPMMISLIEKAAVLSIEPCLEEGQSSVGTHINVSHCAATPIGMKLVSTGEMNHRNTSIVGLAAALGVGISQVTESLSQFPDWVTMVFAKSPVKFIIGQFKRMIRKSVS